MFSICKRSRFFSVRELNFWPTKQKPRKTVTQTLLQNFWRAVWIFTEEYPQRQSRGDYHATLSKYSLYISLCLPNPRPLASCLNSQCLSQLTVPHAPPIHPQALWAPPLLRRTHPTVTSKWVTHTDISTLGACGRNLWPASNQQKTAKCMGWYSLN